MQHVTRQTRSRFVYGHARSFSEQSFTKRQERFSFRIARELLHGRFAANADGDPCSYRQLPDSPQLTFY